MNPWTVLSVPLAAITISTLCFAQPPTTCNQDGSLLFEVYEGQNFTGRCFGSSQVPEPMPFQVRSLKNNTNGPLQFRVDALFNSSDRAGVLIVGGPFAVPNLATLPRRTQDGAGNVGPAGNWDKVITEVGKGFYPSQSGDNTVYTVIGPPPPPDPFGPHRLSDAECETSDRPPQGQAVYKIRRSIDHNTCLAFDANDPEAIPLNNCVTEQKKTFTLLPVPNKCWVIRNGNVNAVPTGRCFHVGEEGDENVGAGICAVTDQQHWKLYQKDGKYLLINQRGGKCLYSDGGGVSVVNCNPGDGNLWWDLVYVRAQ